MVGIVKQYVSEVTKNEHKPDVGAEINAALKWVYKACNHDAGRKLRPPLQSHFLAWVMHRDKDNHIEQLLANDTWNMPTSDITRFMADLRDTIATLSNATKFKRADTWRNAMQQSLVEMASRPPASQVCPGTQPQ